MHAPPSAQNGRQGFTLIELLVVISIVGILAALLLPVFNAVQNSGRKTQVISDEKNLMVALFTYKAEYNKIPANPDQVAGMQATGYDSVNGDPAGLYAGYYVMDVLRAVSEPKYNYNNAMNPSQTVYFNAPIVKNANDPRHGILQKSFFDGTYTLKPGSFVDPWGGEYIIWLDVNGDGDLNRANRWFYSDIPEGQGPKGTFQIGSLGPDGDFGTKSNGKLTGSDDIVLTQ